MSDSGSCKMESQSSQEDMLKYLNGYVTSSQESFVDSWEKIELDDNDPFLFTVLKSQASITEPQAMAENQARDQFVVHPIGIEPPPDLVFADFKVNVGQVQAGTYMPWQAQWPFNQTVSSVVLPSPYEISPSQAVPIKHPNQYEDFRSNDSIVVPDTTQSYGIPSNTNWLGDYHFDISFQEQTEKMTKSTSWTYSEHMDKLFVNMGVSCIVCFRVQKLPPHGCIIRALPIFEKCDHIRNVVKRCPTHSLLSDASNIDHPAPEHLVRCDSEHADYVTDPGDGRHSVIVPFLPPQAGTDSTQYLYKFMCLGSCVGGLNRRPLQLIFTLEHSGKVLGRRALKVRICACPGRDRKSEENALVEGPTKIVKTLAQTTSADTLVFEPVSKRQKFDDELFTLTIQGRENYEMLLKVKESFELASLVPKDIRQAYQSDQQQIPLPTESTTTSSSLLNEVASVSSLGSSVPKTTPILSIACNRAPAIPVSGSRPNLQKTTSIRREVNIDARSCSAKPSTSPKLNIKKEPLELIKSWLLSINMGAYVDVFHERGYKYMQQLETLMERNMDNFPIGNAHRLQIWRALLEYNGMPSCSTACQASIPSSSLRITQRTYPHLSRCEVKQVKSINILPDDE